LLRLLQEEIILLWSKASLWKLHFKSKEATSRVESA